MDHFAAVSRKTSTVSYENASIGVPADLSRMSIVPGGVSDSSQLVGGEDCEFTMNTMILRALSSGVGAPMSCNASRTSRASRTARMPRLSDTPPSTRWRYGRRTLSPKAASARNDRMARAAGRGGLSAPMNGFAHAGGVDLQVPP